MLALQLIRIMDKLWRNDGLDLHMTTFLCLPTGRDEGFVEIVEAETMRSVQIAFPRPQMSKTTH